MGVGAQGRRGGRALLGFRAFLRVVARQRDAVGAEGSLAAHLRVLASKFTVEASVL